MKWQHRRFSSCSIFVLTFLNTFRSDRLWESYIKWEGENQRLQHITALYDRLLATPTQAYATHFERYFDYYSSTFVLRTFQQLFLILMIVCISFQAHVNGNPPNKILSVDEFLKIRQEVLQQLKTSEQSPTAADDAAPPGEDIDAPPGEESEQVKIAVS